MVESISELRKLCRKENDLQTAWVRYFIRPVSIYFTKLLLQTSISANQTSILFIFVGFIGCYFFTLGNPFYNLVGIIFLYLWMIGDACDGEISRYRRTWGMRGIGTFFDWLILRAVTPVIFVCISIGIFHQFNSTLALVIGFLTALFWFLIYILPHIKVIIRMFLRKNKSVLFKRLKFSLSPNMYNKAVRLIFNFNKWFGKSTWLKKFVAKKSIPSEKRIRKKPTYILWYINSRLQSKFLFVQFIFHLLTITTIVDLILHLFRFQFQNFNFMYLFLITVGILSGFVLFTRLFGVKQEFPNLLFVDDIKED
jgi:hypothetical protein